MELLKRIRLALSILTAKSFIYAEFPEGWRFYESDLLFIKSLPKVTVFAVRFDGGISNDQ